MKKIIAILFLVLVSNLLYAQFDRLPLSLNFEAFVPNTLSNKLFVRSFSGNLDWNSNFTYHTKKLEFGLEYRRTNFKAGYKFKAFNPTIKTKLIINSYGIKCMYTFFDNAYFYTQVGINAFYCNGVYTNVSFKELGLPNQKENFYMFEPVVNINYKASEYVDVGFQLSNSTATLRYDPSVPHLDEPTKIDFSDIGTDNGLTNFLSFGFTLKWYLQFEKSE